MLQIYHILRITSLYISLIFALFSGGFVYASTPETIKIAVSEITSDAPDIAKFYADSGYQPLWSGRKNRKRLKDLFLTFEDASRHGIPLEETNLTQFRSDFRSFSNQKRAKADVKATILLVSFIERLYSGILDPRRLSSNLAYEKRRVSRESVFESIKAQFPSRVVETVMPQSDNYRALMEEKQQLEALIANGGLGETVPSYKLFKGHSGDKVQILNSRLRNLGYNAPRRDSFNERTEKAVLQFQSDYGLNKDGVIGTSSLNMLNLTAQERLERVLTAMERERWVARKRGSRHIWVNIADARVTIFEDDSPIFTSRTVVGTDKDEQRTPEFSDKMTHMVINPTWHVPRSIAGKEYLPIMKENANFLRDRSMRLYDLEGKPVTSNGLDLSQYDENTFPFYIKQKPNPANALGLVKFMFPNRFNIYLHDTPYKSLFARDYRAFSHGCIRVKEPFKMAHTLLAPQVKKPEEYFNNILKTKKESYIGLKKHVPVYITYSTAFLRDDKIVYRYDLYGRDAMIFKALQNARSAINPG